MDTEVSHNKPAFEFIALVALMMSVTAMSIDAILPAFDAVRADIAMDNPNRAQLMISMLFFGLALGQLVSGPLSDALGRKPVLFGGLTLFTLGITLCYFATDLHHLLAGRFIQGLGASGPYITAISVVRDKVAGRQMARIMSMVMIIFITIPAIAPSLGQGILWLADWRMIFVFYFFYAALIALWVHFRLEETLPKEKRIPFTTQGFANGFQAVISHKRTRGYTLAMGLMFGSFIGYLNSSQQIFQELYQTGTQFNLYFGGLALVLGASSLFNAKFVVKYGMHYISKRAILGIISSSILFLLLQQLTAPSLLMFVVYAAVIFFCFGLVFGNLNAIAMEPMGKVAGIASALIGATSSLVSMSLGTYIGQAYNHTVMPMTIGFAIVPCIALGIMFWSDKHMPTTHQ